MYVGITRAKIKLYLSYASMRYRFGELSHSSRSRFVDEIEDHLNVLQDQSPGGPQRTSRGRTGTELLESFAPRRKKSETDSQYHSDPMPNYEDESQIAPQVRVGAKVVHETFGAGKIVAIDGRGDSARAIVDFESVGRKHLMLKFANLRPR